MKICLKISWKHGNFGAEKISLNLVSLTEIRSDHIQTLIIDSSYV